MIDPTLTIVPPTAIVVDDFYSDPDAIRAFALQQEFRPDNRHHKGQRSARFAFPGVRKRFESLLGLRILDWDEQPYNGVFQFCVAGDQIVFHSDAQSHAAVVYLTPDAPLQAGSTLYRSRELKGRTSGESAALAGISIKDAQQRMYGGKLLDSTAWEPVDVLGNRYNRCVIWNARLVHAASCYFGSAAQDGRLFQMFFFHAE